jgi:hypothetical protein
VQPEAHYWWQGSARTRVVMNASSWNSPVKVKFKVHCHVIRSPQASSDFLGILPILSYFLDQALQVHGWL